MAATVGGSRKSEFGIRNSEVGRKRSRSLAASCHLSSRFQLPTSECCKVSAEIVNITILPEAVGARLDAFLAAHLGEVSRSAIQRAIESGEVTVNDRTAKPSYKVRAQDEIQVELPEALPLEARPEQIPLDIVFEDDALIVINKPAGMVVHPGAGVSSGTLSNAPAWHFN